jgi:hypothetical protein
MLNGLKEIAMKQFKLTYVPTFLNNKNLKRCVFVRRADSLTQVIEERHYMPDEKEWMLESVEELS